MPKINQEEYEVLKGLDDRWKWIARDGENLMYGGGLQAYTEMPQKRANVMWSNGWGSERLSVGDLFQFIQWEDEEPYNIAELIKEYESEEAEVKKDIEWLKEEINQINPFIELTWTWKRKVLDLINQLDEPEVLSQELPYIPRFVADWYEKEGKKDNWWNWFYKWGRDESRTELETKTIRWMQDFNEELFVDMFRYGYEVAEEREQKYYVDLETAAYVAKWDGNGQVDIYTDGISGSDEYELHLTEQEIKDYDERFWSFAIPVKKWDE